MLVLAISPSSRSAASGADPAAVVVELETVTPVQLAAPSAPGLATRATISNTASSAISFQRGCGTGPVLLLHAQGSRAIFRAIPAVASSSGSCVAQQQVLSPGGSITIANQYELRGYANVAHPTLAGIPRDIYQASLHLTYTLLTGDPAHRYIRASDGDLIDTFPTTWTSSNPTPVQIEGTASPVTAGAPSSIGPFSPKVLVIDYNTSGLPIDGSAALNTQLINAFTTASRYHGGSTASAQFQVYASFTENNPPPILPGTQHGTQTGDYQAVFTKYDICNLAATQGVNFVWIWAAGTEAGGPFYAGDFYEWVATGPSFSQTYGTSRPAQATPSPPWG
jgi:hypothetical protein